MAHYLYAIIDTTLANQPSYGNIGLGQGEVYTVAADTIAAVVSDVDNKRLRPERRNLAAHNQVLQALMQEQTPLPVAFGVIAKHTKSLQRLLAENQETLLVQFERVAGTMEMGLRATLTVPNIMEYFVKTHPELRKARDIVFNDNATPSRDDKIELGRQFDQILQTDRQNHTEIVTAILQPGCIEIEARKCKDEKMIVDLVCLIGRDKAAVFEEMVPAVADHFDDHFAIDYTGPFVPHSFVNLNLRP